MTIKKIIHENGQRQKGGKKTLLVLVDFKGAGAQLSRQNQLRIINYELRIKYKIHS